jgi:hypothetical protein
MAEKKKRRRTTPEEWARWRQTEDRGERLREKLLAEEAARGGVPPENARS